MCDNILATISLKKWNWHVTKSIYCVGLVNHGHLTNWIMSVKFIILEVFINSLFPLVTEKKIKCPKRWIRPVNSMWSACSVVKIHNTLADAQISRKQTFQSKCLWRHLYSQLMRWNSQKKIHWIQKLHSWSAQFCLLICSPISGLYLI